MEDEGEGGGCSDLVVCHQEKGYRPRGAVNQNSTRLLLQGQRWWEWGWRAEVGWGAASPSPVTAQDALSVRAGDAEAAGPGSSPQPCPSAPSAWNKNGGTAFRLLSLTAELPPRSPYI